MGEIYRKSIHVLGGIIPLSYYYYFDKTFMFDSLVILSLIAVILEYLRLHYAWVESIFESIFGFGIRREEINTVTGASYYIVSSLVIIFLFPKNIAAPSLLILSFSDTAAALVGIPFGKHRFLDKSMEGSIAFLSVSIFVLLYFTELHIIFIVLTAIIVTLVEAKQSIINDNFTIPMVTAIMLSLIGVMIR
jgi:dolichol kinase